MNKPASGELAVGRPRLFPDSRHRAPAGPCLPAGRRPRGTAGWRSSIKPWRSAIGAARTPSAVASRCRASGVRWSASPTPVNHGVILNEDSSAVVYIPWAQQPAPAFGVALKTAVDAGTLGEPVRKELLAFDRSVALTQVLTLDAFVEQFWVGQQVFTVILAAASGPWRSCWRRSVPTASWPTRSPSEPRRSASAWRSAPGRG